MARIFQVDAFTDRLFGGNPAAVVLLDSWLEDEILQAVAMENNLAETAFIVPIENAAYELRWYTPSSEVALCGHATLATAYVLQQHLGDQSERIDFLTRKSGVLTVVKAAEGKLSMSFPAIALQESHDHSLVTNALGVEPKVLVAGHYAADEFDYVAVLDSPAEVAKIEPDLAAFKDLQSRGVIVTAAGVSPVNDSRCGVSGDCDFVSRYFAPNIGIDEDPVTGSAHCLLAPYWAGVLDKSELVAHQISARGGILGCRLDGDRTILTGSCVDYLHGELSL